MNLRSGKTYNYFEKCDAVGCRGGRAFTIRDKTFCSPSCGNDYFNLSVNDTDFWPSDSEEEEEEEEEHEYEYTNCGTEKEPRFGTVSYQVAGGGMMNGNAYATIELDNEIYYYCEYGKNASRRPVGNKIVWSDEIFDKKEPYESRSFDIIDEEKEEEEKKTICSACKRDFTDEVDDRSSFDEIGKIICKDCFEEEDEESKFLYPERCWKFWNVELQKHEWRQYLGAGQFCKPEEKQYYKVCCAENPDVKYFDTLHEAKAFCDKHADLDYGLIMLCDCDWNEIGDWGDYDEE